MQTGVNTNKNDMYVYFELIDQIEPKSILDIGLFLERIGNVSRHLFEKDIPEEIRLDGFVCDTYFPVYEKVYNNIYTDCDLVISANKNYDLAVAMDIDSFKEKDLQQIMEFVKKNATYMVLKSSNLQAYGCYGKLLTINIEKDVYGIIIFRE